jgi:hypothetical protein
MPPKTKSVNKRKRPEDDDIDSSRDKEIVSNERNRELSEVPFHEAFGKLISSNIPDHSEYLVSGIGSGQRCDSSKLSAGSFVYRPARIEICSKNGSMFEVKNQETKETWNLNSKLIDTQCFSPDQYIKIEKKTKTELASMLKEEVGDCVCKVEFFKLPEPKEMAKMIREGSMLIEQSDLSEVQKNLSYKKLFERTQVGEYRVIRGYIARSSDQQALESETGMLKFIDAEALAKGEFSMRQINLRNVEALTHKLTRYELK